ncbi:MAG: FTR1 family protein [Gemmatimonadaceae bacterium]
MSSIAVPPTRVSPAGRIALVLGGLSVVLILVWQAITSGGTPDPTAAGTSSPAATLDIAVLVFREGLECILVLSAITADMRDRNHDHRRTIAWGAVAGLGATVVTWFIAIQALDALSSRVSALALQAATGLLAIVVLLVVMNWFFHRVYWAGWIGMHNRRKRDLLNDSDGGDRTRRRLLFGLAALGFTSLYREGFEVVLFLQTYRLKLGSSVVYGGVALGALLVLVIGVLTFIARRRLPHKQMLVVTGALLGAVLLVMVGEQGQEMQLAGWIPTTTIAVLNGRVPGWAGLWFSVFPTVQTLGMQALAALLVIGSYVAARRRA